jgi:two-component system, sensor histidine kinase and response regulator
VTQILVIDDESVFRALTVEILRDHGYGADSAPDGAAGLAMACQDPPDLVLCDLKMDGLSGYDVLAALRRDPRTAVVPVIFLTGQGGDAAVRRGMNLGADDYLVKPVPTETLIKTLQARLDRSRAVRQEATRRLTDLRSELARSLLPHELLTPLTVVMGLASLLEEDGAIEAGQVKEVAEGILQGAHELETMITKFLLYAEIQAAPATAAPEPARAAAVVVEAARDRAARVRREGDLVVEAGAFRSTMPPDHLKGLVHELVENALEFSAPGSTVTVRGRPDGDAWVLSVADGGRGMTEEQVQGLERAPFLRRNEAQPGIGLGLTIVRKLAEMYGGHVSFDTAPGRGTTVSVRFADPAAPATHRA